MYIRSYLTYIATNFMCRQDLLSQTRSHILNNIMYLNNFYHEYETEISDCGFESKYSLKTKQQLYLTEDIC